MDGGGGGGWGGELGAGVCAGEVCAHSGEGGEEVKEVKEVEEGCMMKSISIWQYGNKHENVSDVKVVNGTQKREELFMLQMKMSNLWTN